MNALINQFNFTKPTIPTGVLRPVTLEDYIGQPLIKDQAQLKINLSRKTGVPMTHTLLLGFSGAGKTTLAKIIASEMGVNFHECMAANIKNENDLIELINCTVTHGTILFIDEIHALKKDVQECLYTIMEDFRYFKKGSTGSTESRDLPRFTVIGATTHAGNLNQPFLERFGWKPTLQAYTTDELSELISKAAFKKYNIELLPEITESVAKICQNTPRRAMHLLQNLFDHANGMIVENRKLTSDDITIAILEKTIRNLELDPVIGLDRAARQYLSVLYSERGKPIGSRSLAAMLNQQEVNLLNMIEPYLTQPDIEVLNPETGATITGPLVKITRQGRVPTPSTTAYLKLCNQMQKQHGWFPGERFNID